MYSDSGIALELSEAIDLQKLDKPNGNYLLQLEWVDEKLLVFSNQTTSDLLSIEMRLQHC